MYRVLLVGLLLLAIPAMARAEAVAKPDAAPSSASEKKAESGVANRIRVGDVDTEPVSVIAIPPMALSLADRILLGGVIVLLAIVIAQLVFLRSSIERLVGEKSLANPTGTVPPR
jgi:hypothetical protein